MKVGDLVRYRWPSYLGSPPDDYYEKDNFGIILSIDRWVDKGAPDRNFGIKVRVMWHNQPVGDYESDELDVVGSYEE